MTSQELIAAAYDPHIVAEAGRCLADALEKHLQQVQRRWRKNNWCLNCL